MWILTEQLITSHFAPDTKALEWDSETFGRMCEKSLMWRSKPSQLRTWQQRLKRVGYIRHLFTRILKPSHSNTFLEKWISFLPDSHANPLVLPEDDNQQMIRDIYTHISLKESHSVDQLMLFSKMSKESSQAKPQTENRYLNMSSETWKKEVISHRGEYSARLKLVRPINEKESLSWPTATVADIRDGQHLRERTKQWMAEGKVKGINLTHATENKECQELYEKRATKNWPTPRSQDTNESVENWDKRKKKWKKKGINLQKSLKIEAERNEKNWPTPTSTEKSGINPKTGKGEGLSKQAKNWATPNTMDYLPPKEGESQERIFRTHRKGRKEPCNLREQVNPKSWPTPQVGEEKASKPGGTQNQKMLFHVAIGLPDQDKSNTSGKNPGRLNPNWVEQLMGLPVGWTQLPTELID